MTRRTGRADQYALSGACPRQAAAAKAFARCAPLPQTRTVSVMTELITIPDPIVALMLTEHATTARQQRAAQTRGLRHRRRRFEQAARLRRLLA
jgi:hypothetical protein